MNTRREFFSKLLGETVTQARELRGTPQFKLSELDKLDDQQMAKLIPVVIDSSLKVDSKGQLLISISKNKKNPQSYSLSTIQQYTLTQFDGKASLKDIGNRVANRFQINSSEGFAAARTLFIALGKCYVCAPVNPL